MTTSRPIWQAEALLKEQFEAFSTWVHEDATEGNAPTWITVDELEQLVTELGPVFAAQAAGDDVTAE